MQYVNVQYIQCAHASQAMSNAIGYNVHVRGCDNTKCKLIKSQLTCFRSVLACVVLETVGAMVTTGGALLSAAVVANGF